MKKVYLFTVFMLGSLIFNACSTSDDPHTEPDSNQATLRVEELKLGNRNEKQFNYNAAFPISFQAKLSDASDALKGVSVTLLDGKEAIFTQEFEGKLDFEGSFIVTSEQNKFKEQNYRLRIELTSAKGLKTKIEETLRFVNFYIEKAAFSSFDNQKDYPNELFLNSYNSTFQFLDLHYEGTLQAVRYYFEKEDDATKNFMLAEDPKNVTSDEEGLLRIYIPSDKLMYDGKEQPKVTPGLYSVYMQYQTTGAFTAPILLQNNVTIHPSMTQYSFEDFKLQATPTSTTYNTFKYEDGKVVFYIKGLKEIYAHNANIRSIGVRILNLDGGQITANFNNYIFENTPLDQVEDQYKFEFPLKKTLNTFDVFVDLEFKNGMSEAINLGKIHSDGQ